MWKIFICGLNEEKNFIKIFVFFGIFVIELWVKEFSIIVNIFIFFGIVFNNVVKIGFNLIVWVFFIVFLFFEWFGSWFFGRLFFIGNVSVSIRYI